ncbi:MAG: S-methyl-5-thioribose-1-phosphate isomerase [Eubacteriales bacterium]|nr:S-methyl-5-thioribose-1-phosphate isomerase [Eubacteriales bacterium]
MSKANILHQDTVALDEQTGALIIIDQTLLPGTVKLLSLTELAEIREAIYLLRVRGAPAIGVAAAIGLYVVMLHSAAKDEAAFREAFAAAKATLAAARPTAVNLCWALERMEKAIKRGGTPNELLARLHDEALRIRDEDVRVCRAIGENGLTLLKDGDGVLTHCNAGQLATVRYGTALAPIHVGVEKGYHFKLFTDETRPLLQGARLSAYELMADGVDTTVICDNMASQVMKNGWVQAVLVGCDRVAANGDTANKIGTSGVAVLAKHYGVPFYVCAPFSTIDLRVKTGGDIPIEERPGEEVTEMWYQKPMAPQGVKVYNPAFDVTEHELITAFITERGVLYPPFEPGFRKAFGSSEGEEPV